MSASRDGDTFPSQCAWVNYNRSRRGSHAHTQAGHDVPCETKTDPGHLLIRQLSRTARYAALRRVSMLRELVDLFLDGAPQRITQIDNQ